MSILLFLIIPSDNLTEAGYGDGSDDGPQEATPSCSGQPIGIDDASAS